MLVAHIMGQLSQDSKRNVFSHGLTHRTMTLRFMNTCRVQKEAEVIKSPRELTDVEIRDAYEAIIEMYLKANNEPIRQEFAKSSRMAQFGYDVSRYLFDNDHVRIGDGIRQEELNV